MRALLLTILFLGTGLMAEAPSSIYDFTVLDIQGQQVSLAKYRGRAVLIVNVASKCGLTPQYEQLQALHERYSPLGLSILGFPANNFGGQEPGTNEEIRMFCKRKYSIAFDMFSKISVKGEDLAPLYQYLTGIEPAGDIRWNFEKFVFDREGRLVGRFEPKTGPQSQAVTAAIETALGAPLFDAQN